MSNIQEIITTNFTQNIEYFQTHHKELFEKLAAYDHAVTQGYYKEKYELVYENGDFDVYERESGIYLYNKQIKKHTELSVKNIDFSTQDYCFEGFLRQQYLQEDVTFYQQLKQQNPLKSIASYVADILYITEQERVDFLHNIGKYIFFGVGLGRHLDAIMQKVLASCYLIVEDDLELFRLSLFCTNYPKLAQNTTLFFSVFENQSEFAKTSERFLKEQYYLNHYIKYFHLQSHKTDKIEQFYIATSSQADLKFLFTDYMRINTIPLQNIANGYNILKKDFDLSSLENIPFLLVASGPSLEKNREFLQQNQEKFVIVAVSSSLSFLEKYNIKPNIVIHLDPFEASIKSFERLENLSFLQESILLFSASSPQKLLEMFPKEKSILFESNTHYKKDAFHMTSNCVGSVSYLFLLLTKVKNIYLLGLDLAVDSKTKSDHIQLHQDKKTLDTFFSSEKELLYKENLFEIDGNFDEKVFTTAHLNSSVNIINHYFSKLIDPSQHIYNLSDGAYFHKTKALHCKNIQNFQPLKAIQTQLQQLFTNHQTKGFSSQDRQNLQNRFEYIKKIKADLLNHTFSTQTPKQYAQEIVDIITQQNALDTFELARVLDSYLYYILNYIYNFFDNPSTTQEQKEKVDKLLKEQIFSLIAYYEKILLAFKRVC